MVRTGDIRLIVKDVEASLTAIDNEAQRLNGYSSAQNSGAGGSPRRSDSMATKNSASFGSITVRVPPANFDELRLAVKAMAEWVQADRVNTEDISFQYFDTTARIASLTAAHKRLLALIDKATDHTAVASLFRESVQMEQDLSSLQGSIRRMSDQAQFSTLTIHLSLPPDVLTRVPPVFWSPWRTLERAISTLGDTLRHAVDGIIWVVVVYLPFMAVVAFALWAAGAALVRHGIIAVATAPTRETSRD